MNKNESKWLRVKALTAPTRVGFLILALSILTSSILAAGNQSFAIKRRSTQTEALPMSVNHARAFGFRFTNNDDDVRIRVGSFYRELLGREATQAEVNAWAATPYPAEVVYDMIKNSEEGKNFGIRNWYRELLDREATQAEVDSWLTTGLSADAIRNAIADSSEGRSIAIRRLYRELLDREATQAEVNSWLATGLSVVRVGSWFGSGLPINEIRYAIADSSEAKSFLIRYLYRNYLGREATQAEVDSWINSGLSNYEIIKAIENSSEAREYRLRKRNQEILNGNTR